MNDPVHGEPTATKGPEADVSTVEINQDVNLKELNQ
jgi:hypothetical protein